MRPILSREQIRAFDQRATAAGVPGLVLMENAGRGAAHLIGLKGRPRTEAAKPAGPVRGGCVRCADERALAALRVAIVCGSGNNGGDGFVVARHLLGRGAEVSVQVVSDRDRVRGDALTMLQALEAVGGRVDFVPNGNLATALGNADIVVDALLGTGLDREVAGTKKVAVEAINEAGQRPGCRVIALDVPSGLDAQTGEVLGVAVRAEHTVTFAHLKRGLLTTHGQAQAGRITVSHIGVPSSLPKEVQPAAWLLEQSDVARLLAPRPAVAHKGSAGRITIVAGSAGTLGAARLTSHASLRAGGGLVRVASSEAAIDKLEHSVREVMTERIPADAAAPPDALLKADALAVGPGLGQSEQARRLLQLCLDARRPCVIDADGLNVIEKLEELSEYEGLVLTPHPGEAARLLNLSVTEIENDRFGAAERLAARSGATVVLKGPRTIVAHTSQSPRVSVFGSPALATGGSGDVLTGLLATNLAQEANARDEESRADAPVGFDAAVLSVALQGLAAELWSERHGDRGLIAAEVADLVPEVIRQVLDFQVG